MTKKAMVGMTVGIPATLLFLGAAVTVILHELEVFHLIKPVLYASIFTLLIAGAGIVFYTKYVLVKEVFWPKFLKK
jgi:hypothetical protein